MSNGKSNATRGGFSLTFILGIIFVVLKLTGNVDWSWWWVLLPFWGIWGSILAVVLVFMAMEKISNL